MRTLLLFLTALSCAAQIPAPGSGWGGSSSSSGALVLVETKAANASASLDFTSCISSTYDQYQIEIVNLYPASDAATLLFRVSTDGGSNFVATGYQWMRHGSSGTGQAQTGSASDTSVILTVALENTAGLYGVNGTLSIYHPIGGTQYTVVRSALTGLGSSGTGIADMGVYFGMGASKSTTAVNAFRLIMSSGNIASGTVRCYGVAK